MKRIDQWKLKLRAARAEERIRAKQANSAARALAKVRNMITELEAKIERNVAGA